MNRILNFFKANSWAILSGVLMGTSYIPLTPWALLFCWIPLWLDLSKENSRRKVFFKAWITQFILTILGFFWIAHVSHEFAFIPWSFSILILIAFAAVAHLYIPFAAVIAHLCRQKFKLSPFAFFVIIACLQNLGEMYWPTIFAWNLGYPFLAVQSGVSQWSDVIGFLGISWLVHLFQAQLCWQTLNLKSKPIWLITFGSIAFLLALELSGKSHAEPWKGDRFFTATLVQANIGNIEKIYAEKGMGYQRDILDKYFNLSWQALKANPNTDLLIWPESAVPEYLDIHNQERRYAQIFLSELKRLNRSLLTGAYSNDTPDTVPREDYNALFVFDENAKLIAPAYHKTHLLIFGEYVPLGKVFPILRKWNPGGEGFGVGSGAEVINWRNLKIGPQICYDSLYPFFSNKLAREGADFFVNVTNDSWFGPYFEPEQHLYMTLARAIETRRPLLRSTNTGVTTIIDAQGNIGARSPLFKEWFQSYDVPYKEKAPLTFYAQHGVLLSLLPLFVVVLILGASLRATSRLERNS